MRTVLSVDATDIDTSVMAHLVANVNTQDSEALRMIRSAFEKQTIVVGVLNKRAVQAAAVSLSKSAPNSGSTTVGKRVIDTLPNPFPSPHNLAWYLRSCDCPADIRAFATRLGRRNIRVWSVGASDPFTWKVLVQVFASSSAKEATEVVERDAARPAKILKGRVVSGVSHLRKKPSLDLPSYAKVIAAKDVSDTSHFVEVTISR